jgi:hypothetical protein
MIEAASTDMIEAASAAFEASMTTTASAFPAPLLLADVGTQLLLTITVTAIAIEVQIPLLQNSSAENYDSGM